MTEHEDDPKENILPSVSSLIVVKAEPPVNQTHTDGGMEGVKEIAKVAADGLQFLGLCDSDGRI